MRTAIAALCVLNLLLVVAQPTLAGSSAPAANGAPAGASTGSSGMAQHPKIKHEVIKHEVIKHEVIKHVAKSSKGVGGGSGPAGSGGAQGQNDSGEIKAPKVGIKYGGP